MIVRNLLMNQRCKQICYVDALLLLLKEFREIQLPNIKSSSLMKSLIKKCQLEFNDLSNCLQRILENDNVQFKKKSAVE